jgi:hypothetical protein
MKRGAKVQSDTIYTEVITERTITDTLAVVKDVIKHDTITLNTVRWRSKTVFKDSLIWQQVECKPDTVRIPTLVKTTISAPFNWRPLIVVITLLVLLLYLVKKK